MSYYNNGNQNNYGGGYNAGGYGQQAPQQQQQESDFDDYYTHNNTSNQWDSRSAKSSHTMHSNYSTMPMNKPYEEQPPMPAPYQQPNPVVDYPPTHRVQFPGGFGGPQRTHTGESGGFSTAREKLLKRRVRWQCSVLFTQNTGSLFLSILRYFWNTTVADSDSTFSQSARSHSRMAISSSMCRSHLTLSLLLKRARNLQR